MNLETIPSIRELNRHIESLFIQHLRKAGDQKTPQVTYKELGELVSQDPTSHGVRRLLNKARKKVLDDYGYLFETKSGVGLRLLSDSDKLTKVGATHRKRISRETTVWREKHDSINPHNLDQTGLKALLREEMQLSAQEELETSRMRKRIDAAVEVSQKQLTADMIRKAMHDSARALADMG